MLSAANILPSDISWTNFTSLQVFADYLIYKLSPAFSMCINVDSRFPLCCSAFCFHITYDLLTQYKVYSSVLSIAYLSPPLECKLIHNWCSINICRKNIILSTHKSLCFWLPNKNLEFHREDNKWKLLNRCRIYIQYLTFMCIGKLYTSI